MRDRGYDELMKTAASAADDTTELQDEEGRVARIARDESYPGARRVTLDATEDQIPYPTLWILPASESRPSFFPDEVPFVSGVSCRAKQANRRLYVNWDDEHATATDPELGRRLAASTPAAVRDTLDMLRARMGAGEPLGQAGLEKVTEMLEDESVQEWTASGMKASKPSERLVIGFESILTDCLEAGWQEEDISEDLPSAHLIHRAVALRRGELKRALVLSGALGTSRLGLTQEPAEAPDSAP